MTEKPLPPPAAAMVALPGVTEYVHGGAGNTVNCTGIDTVPLTVPLATTMDEQIDRLRRWAEGRARNASLGK